MARTTLAAAMKCFNQYYADEDVVVFRGRVFVAMLDYDRPRLKVYRTSDVLKAYREAVAINKADPGHRTNLAIGECLPSGVIS